MNRMNIGVITFSVILGACSAHETNIKMGVGSLEPIWIIDPLDISAEPWFGGALRADIFQDYIFVADTIRGQILVLNHKGNFVRYIGAKGSGPGEYRRVAEVQVSPEGSIYVNPGFSGILYQYTLTGEHVTQHRHTNVLSRNDLTVSARMEILSNDLFVYSVSLRGGNRDIEIARASPLVAFIMEDTLVTAGECILTENEERTRASLRSTTGSNAYRAFSKGSICKGINPLECIYMRTCNPYTIYILSPDLPMQMINYYTSDDPEVAIIHKDIPADDYESFRSSIRVDYNLDISDRTKTRNMMTFKHSQRGFYLDNTDLYIYIEVLNDENTSKYLYKVDLIKGIPTHRIPVEIAGHPQFVGISPNGLFIFEVTDPHPGLAAYNIKLK